MAIIVPPPSDKQSETLGHHVCPSCGKAASKTVDRQTSTGTVNTDCVCTGGHIWSVHWLGGAA